MSDGKENEVSLEWLKVKTDKGKTPDFVIKAQMENVGNKFIRKFKENPFVPIGNCFDINMIQFLFCNKAYKVDTFCFNSLVKYQVYFGDAVFAVKLTNTFFLAKLFTAIC